MHEMSIAEGVRTAVEAALAAEGAVRVERVRLEIGALAGVEPAALAFAFEVVMRGSVLEGAALEILPLPGRAFCYDCGRAVEIASRLAPCPACGGERLLPQGGDEMRIKDVEVI